MAERDELHDPRVSESYRRLGAEHPPAALDAAILAASRRAVGAGPRRPGTLLRRWALPVSVAAVVVLTMSIVVRVQLEKPDFELAAPIPATVPPADDIAASRKAQEKDEVARLAKRNEAAEEQPKTKASAPPAAVASAPAAGDRERPMARQATPEPAPAQRVPPVPAAPPPAFVPEPPARSPAPAETPAPSQLGAASAVQPGAAASIADARADRPSSEDAQVASRLAPRAVTEDRARGSMEEAGKTDAKKELPREWLERIAKLRREGRAKEADESLAEFRRRYPDYEIPKELRDAVLGEAR